MKKLLLFFIALTTLSLTKSEAQVTTKIAGDTIKLYQTGTPGNAELILQNSTRSRTNAFLQNRNNGRTQFAYVVDSVWVDLNQIKFRRGPSTISVNLAALISDNDSSYKRGDSLFFRKSNTEIFVGLFSGIDTTSLSNRINLKLNISDTAAMLLPYQRDRDTTLWDATKTDIINAIAAIPTPGIDATIVADNQLHANRTIDLNRKKISFDGDSRGQIEFFQLKDFYLSVEDTTGMPQIILRGYGDGIGGNLMEFSSTKSGREMGLFFNHTGSGNIPQLTIGSGGIPDQGNMPYIGMTSITLQPNRMYLHLATDGSGDQELLISNLKSTSDTVYKPLVRHPTDSLVKQFSSWGAALSAAGAITTETDPLSLHKSGVTKLTGNVEIRGNNNTYYTAFDSLNYFRVARDGVTRMYMSNANTTLTSPNGNYVADVNNVYSALAANSYNNYLKVYSDSGASNQRISYTHNVAGTYTDFSFITKHDLDSAIGTAGGTQNLNSVLHHGATADTSILLTVASNAPVFVVAQDADGAGALIGALDNVGIVSISNPPSNVSLYAPTTGSWQQYFRAKDGTIALLSDITDSITARSNTDSLFGNQDNLPAQDRAIDFNSTYDFSINHGRIIQIKADTVGGVGYGRLNLSKINYVTGLGSYSTAIPGASAYFRSHYNSGKPYAQIAATYNNNSANETYFKAAQDSSVINLYNGVTSIPLYIRGLTAGPGTMTLRVDPSNGNITYGDTTAGGGGFNIYNHDDSLTATRTVTIPNGDTIIFLNKNLTSGPPIVIRNNAFPADYFTRIYDGLIDLNYGLPTGSLTTYASAGITFTPVGYNGPFVLTSSKNLRFRTKAIDALIIDTAQYLIASGYASGSKYQNDTSSYKPVVVGSDGKFYQSSWFGGGGGSGSKFGKIGEDYIAGEARNFYINNNNFRIYPIAPGSSTSASISATYGDVSLSQGDTTTLLSSTLGLNNGSAGLAAFYNSSFKVGVSVDSSGFYIGGPNFRQQSASYVLYYNPSTDLVTYEATPTGGSYTDEQAQDAVGAMVNASLQYVDGTPLLAIGDRDYGDITFSGSGLTATVDANITKTWTGYHSFTAGFSTTSYQTITSGSSSTVSNGTTTVRFDPAADLTAYTLTMPASPTDGQWIYISFGGTVSAGNAVSTSFTLSPNSGQSIYSAITPTQGYGGDEMAFQYKSSNTTWYRKK